MEDREAGTLKKTEIIPIVVAIGETFEDIENSLPEKLYYGRLQWFYYNYEGYGLGGSGHAIFKVDAGLVLRDLHWEYCQFCGQHGLVDAIPSYSRSPPYSISCDSYPNLKELKEINREKIKDNGMLQDLIEAIEDDRDKLGLD